MYNARNQIVLICIYNAGDQMKKEIRVYKMHQTRKTCNLWDIKNKCYSNISFVQFQAKSGYQILIIDHNGRDITAEVLK